MDLSRSAVAAGPPPPPLPTAARHPARLAPAHRARGCRIGLAAGIVIASLLSTSCATAAPDEAALGKAEGYPLGTPRTWFYEERTRVGSFSHLDRILPHHTLKRSATAAPLPRAPRVPALTYRFENKVHTIEDLLARQRVTGLLVIKDGAILAEHYQYDRKPEHRLVSHSMAKSVTSLAVGLLLSEGRIRSLDDPVARYVPQLAGRAYGETSIRNILRMASGVRFREVYDGKDDLATFSGLRAREGTIAALAAFNERQAPAGSRFAYASAETVVLAALVTTIAGTSMSEYLATRLWQPMGAEADATWTKAASDGMDNGGGGFNAVLRDYGRLGVLLANDGAIGAKQIIPKDYLIEATDWRRQPEAFRPGKATPYMGYGYQFWLYPGDTRRFVLVGVYGQAMYVDPALKLVLVMTGVAKQASVAREAYGRERDALWRGLVTAFGGKL